MLSITGLGVAEIKVQAHTAALAEAQQTSEQADATSTSAAVDIAAQTPAHTLSANVAQAAEKVAAAFTGDWEEGDERDFDDDEDDRPTQAAIQAQTATRIAPAEQPASTKSPNAGATTVGGYTMAQVAAHNSSASCYTAINGTVYDLTSFIHQHPGGSGAIISLCGIDGSSAFNAQHAGSRRPANELAGLEIGVLAK